MALNLRTLVKSTSFESFKDKNLQIYYDDTISSINEKNLPKKEFPALTIIPDKTMKKKFIVSSTDDGYYKWFIKVKDYAFLKTAINYATLKNAHRATNNHVSIYINNPEQLKYLETLKPLFKNIVEYCDTDKHY